MFKSMRNEVGFLDVVSSRELGRSSVYVEC